MLALRAAESVLTCPGRVGLTAGEVVVLVVATEDALAESSSRWRRMDSCSSWSSRYRRRASSLLCRGKLSQWARPEMAGVGKAPVDMMTTAFGVDFEGLWHGKLGCGLAGCVWIGGEARMLIVKDLWWVFEVVIGTLLAAVLVDGRRAVSECCDTAGETWRSGKELWRDRRSGSRFVGVTRSSDAVIVATCG